jgi:hypothetical protein
MKTVLFFDPNLNERGTSIATYDYAHFNETILKNKSVIVSLNTSELKSFDKFNSRFDTHIFDSFSQIQNLQCDYFYSLKYGFNDNMLHPEAKNLVHAVFPSYDPHGDVYAYVSKWLAETYGNSSSYVPHMVNLPESNLNFKEFFNIKDQLVIGWYGGNNFEIPFAKQAVVDIATKRNDIIFLFMNQDPFCDLHNVIFVEGTINQEQKVAFINTCDIMIHARERGETFGLAIAEFSSKNKPIITYSQSPEKCHIDILGDKGIYYNDYKSLYNLLSDLQLSDIKNKEWDCYKDFTPENVISKFNQIFLQ